MLPYAELAVFAQVVESGGFSAAARKLGTSKAAVSEQVRRLEARLGARLLNRTTRRVSPTEAGAACLAHCTRMIAEAEAAARAAELLHASPVGRLRVTAPQTFAALHVVPAIASFLALHPRLEVELSSGVEVVDLVEERFDLAIRIGALADSSLVSRRLAWTKLVIVAAPAYLARRGTPESIEALAEHDALAFTPLGWGDEWRLRDALGERRRVPVRVRFATDSGEALLAAVCAGLGCAVVPDWMAERELARGELVTLLPGCGREPVPIQALHAAETQAAAKIRLFIDHLARHLRDASRWDQGRAASQG